MDPDHDAIGSFIRMTNPEIRDQNPMGNFIETWSNSPIEPSLSIWQNLLDNQYCGPTCHLRRTITRVSEPNQIQTQRGLMIHTKSVPSAMVPILDSNIEIRAHVRSNLCYLTCLWYLINSRAVTNRMFLSKALFRSCVRNMFRVTI